LYAETLQLSVKRLSELVHDPSGDELFTDPAGLASHVPFPPENEFYPAPARPARFNRVLRGALFVNCVRFLGPLATEEFFRVIWVTPEVKDKVVEPMASVEEVSGEHPGIEKFREALLAKLSAKLGIETEPGELKRDELFGYEKTRALAYRKG
jgi:hypothetical protein